MKVEAAALVGTQQPYKIVDIELDQPKEREVLVELTASGLCHSDDHLVTGDMPVPPPMVAGHEGAGVVVFTVGVITVGVLHGELLAPAMQLIAKGGTSVLTSV